MPDQFAHYIFARRVLAAADDSLRARICASSAAFRAGSFGPDPLFNDPSPYCRAEGFALHRQAGAEALGRMRGPVKQRMPWAAEYAAGFFCHYALDRLCHPYILEMAERGVARHVSIESAYDRELMLRENARLPRRIRLSKSALRAAACMYRRVGPRRLQADIDVFWQIRRFTAFGGGTGLAAVPGKINPDWDGLIPRRDPAPGLRECFARLDRLMEEGVETAARQMKLYFRAIDRDLPFDEWMNADFSGFQTQL